MICVEFLITTKTPDRIANIIDSLIGEDVNNDDTQMNNDKISLILTYLIQKNITMLLQTKDEYKNGREGISN